MEPNWLFSPLPTLSISSDPLRLEWLEAVTRCKIPAEVLRVALRSHRILVMDAPAEERYGSIIIPPNSQEEGEEGFILSLSPSAGLGSSTYESFFSPEELDDYGSLRDAQRDLLGRHVAYRFSAGYSIRETVADSGYNGRFKVMHAKDILFWHNDEAQIKVPGEQEIE